VAISAHWNIPAIKLTMTAELQKYLLEQCREWMLPEEIRALTRIGLTKHGEEVTRKLALLGIERMHIRIAERLLKDSAATIINNCPKCGKLARTPRAKQCRHCKHDWH